ncbi:MAG: hypothetical protein IT230_05005 [Flavobacteriales bacterium]|nr:hypothetical protein [Flavobacteriales bacterium]
MDRERLAELLKQPAQVAGQDLDGLRSMAEHFPWFSGARLLLAVGEQRSGNMLAQEGHSAPAAHLPSRQVLYDLVHDTPPEPVPTRWEMPEVPPPPVPQAPVPGATAIVAIAPQTHPVAPAAPQPEPVDVPSEAAPLDDSPELQPWPEVQSGALPVPAPEPVPETAIMSDEGPASEAEAQERSFLDRLFIEAATSSYDLEQWTAPGKEEPTTGTNTPRQEPPETTWTAEAAISAPPDIPPSPPAPAPPDPRRLRFTDWLDQTEALAPAAPPPATLGPRPSLAVAAPATASGTTSPLGASGQARPTPPTVSQGELLDRFIQQAAPPAPTEKAAFFNPQKAAKRSLQDDGLVSETLARIHEQQGNFAKAREVYERLAAKHPEKSVYFAALSKALEGRSNK